MKCIQLTKNTKLQLKDFVTTYLKLFATNVSNSFEQRDNLPTTRVAAEKIFWEHQFLWIIRRASSNFLIYDNNRVQQITAKRTKKLFQTR